MWGTVVPPERHVDIGTGAAGTCRPDSICSESSETQKAGRLGCSGSSKPTPKHRTADGRGSRGCPVGSSTTPRFESPAEAIPLECGLILVALQGVREADCRGRGPLPDPGGQIFPGAHY